MVNLNISRELRTVGNFTYKVTSVGLLTAHMGVEICTNSPRPHFDGILSDLDDLLLSVCCCVVDLVYESSPNGNLYTFLYSVNRLPTKED